MNAGTYIFKPKSEAIALRVIEAFGNGWLNWEESSSYMRARPVRKDVLALAGYIQIDIDCDGQTQENTECCWHDAPVETHHLTADMLVVLDEEDFFQPDDDGNKIYNFEDVELSELVVALAQNNSRIISPFDAKVWICEKDENGKLTYRTVDLINYFVEEA